MTISTARPKHLNLFKIRFPVTAIASIAHRISGLLLFLWIPFLIYFMAVSVRSERDYLAILSWLDNGLVKFSLLIFLWALVHHLLAGIRYLLLDIDVGVDLKSARLSAWFVSLAGVGIFVWAVIRILL